MSSVFGIFVFVAIATCCPLTSAWMWNWGSTEPPENCPHQNNETHVCSTLQSSASVCITIDCCENFEDDEEVEEYSEDNDDNDDHGGHHGGHGGSTNGGCSWCMSIRSCTLYRCRTTCCDGYERDYMGRCVNKTGNLQCENGGVLRRTWWGTYCKCPHNFGGHNCENPICNCLNGGECIIKDGQPFCNCTEGYHGVRCGKSNCTTQCYNGGICYRYGDNEFCWCPDAYIGNQCQQRYTNPDTCPTPERTSDMCECECSSNEDCEENHVCCKEGCSSVCRRTKPQYCLHEGRRYDINSTYSPDPCTNCTCTDTGEMLCYSVSCAVPDCLYGEPVVIPGQCCPSCPNKPDPPKLYNCPTSVLTLITKSHNDQAWLAEASTNIKANDSEGNLLTVNYRPDKVHHCHCGTSVSSQTLVQAYVTDKYNSIATCSFKVTVKDVYPPRFTYCPRNITVSENTAVVWSQPTYSDNVGIARVMVPELESGDVFPVGNYTVSYAVYDYDGNKASCNFTVSVLRDPPRITNCPADVLRLNTSYYSNYAVLNELSTGIYAFDSENNKLQVHYNPPTVGLLGCTGPEAYTVEATATDEYGKNVKCTFKVTVKDIYPPKFTHCPEDMTITEGEDFTWEEPTYYDNVDICRHNKDVSGTIGQEDASVVYNIWDNAGNTASCKFTVYVEKKVPPKIRNCPNHAITMSTQANKDYVELTESTTSMAAYDGDGNKLKVNFEPSSVRHCYCNNSATNQTPVQASAVDLQGDTVTCQFKIVVVDQIKPVVTYCPGDINVDENEIVTWRDVECYDNVKVVRKSVTGRKPGSTFPVGVHPVRYEFWDFDGNSAICLFNVNVAKAKCTLECYNGGVCYRNNNDQQCRCPPEYVGKQCEQKYVHTHCQYEGRQYLVNEAYIPDPCTTCTCANTGEMVCYSVQCAVPKCLGGRKPVSKPGQCCLGCPEEPKPRITCPPHTVHLNTSENSNRAELVSTATHVKAFDSFNRELTVHYRPQYVSHCNCHNPLEQETIVEAYALDSYGNVASCKFKVVVRDIHPPKVLSCPENVYLFDEQIAIWKEPRSTDNVGVAGKICSSKKNGTVFPVGEHLISCDVWDYDKNTASCHFSVVVSKKDTPEHDLPLGHREKIIHDKSDKLRFILPPILGAVVLAVLVVLLIYLCRRKCKPDLLKMKSAKSGKTENIYAKPRDTDSRHSSKSKRSSLSTYSSATSRTVPSQALAFHNNVYAVPGDIGVRPPPYTPHRYDPPSYSISGSVKDVEYMSLPLPSYPNPEYETLGVHRSSVYSPSVVSMSTVGSRAGHSRSTKSSRRSTAGSVKSSRSSKLSYKA